MPNSGYIVPGYDKDAYPDIVAPVPAVYHKYLSMKDLENIYTEEEINNLFNKAYFVSNPDAFPSAGYKGAVCEYADVCASGQILLPGSKDSNQVIKRMSVRNLGKEKAWIRLFIAIPSILDDEDASQNTLHFNANKDVALAEGQWNWGKAMDREAGSFVGPSGWNTYTTEIKNIAYNVYVVTLETAVEPGMLTTEAIHQVYLDAKCKPEDIIKVNKIFGTDKWQMYAAAEAVTVTEADPEKGIEADTDAFDAFNKIYTEVGDDKHNPFK